MHSPTLILRHPQLSLPRAKKEVPYEWFIHSAWQQLLAECAAAGYLLILDAVLSQGVGEAEESESITTFIRGSVHVRKKWGGNKERTGGPLGHKASQALGMNVEPEVGGTLPGHW